MVSWSRRLFGRARGVRDAVGPIFSPNRAAGHRFADLNQLLVRPRLPSTGIVEQRQQAPALPPGRRRHTGCFEQSGRKVDEADKLGDLLRAMKAWSVDKQRYAEGAVVGAAFVLLVTSHEVAAVIAHEDEDGVVGEMFLFEDTADTPYRGVDRFNATVVVRQLRLPRARKRP